MKTFKAMIVSREHIRHIGAAIPTNDQLQQAGSIILETCCPWSTTSETKCLGLLSVLHTVLGVGSCERLPPMSCPPTHADRSSRVNLSLMHPRLLSTLILIEPVIQGGFPPGPNAAMASTFRPDLWPTRAAAESTFRKNRFFRTWDKRVLDKYLQFGLRNVPTALYPVSADGQAVPPDAVTLTTTKHQEVWVYLRSNFDPQDERQDKLLNPDLDLQTHGQFPFTRAESWITQSNLPRLRPSVLYIWGAASELYSPEGEAEKMAVTGVGVGGSGGAKAGKVERIVVKGHGHMVPCTFVRGCAEYAADWLGRWLTQYKADEDFYRNHDSKKSARGMLVVSDEWKKRVRESSSVTRPVKGKL